MNNMTYYKTAMSQPVYTRSKKSPMMNYLKELVNELIGNTYTVRGIKKEVLWADLNKPTYYKVIVICLLRGSDDS